MAIGALADVSATAATIRALIRVGEDNPETRMGAVSDEV